MFAGWLAHPGQELAGRVYSVLCCHDVIVHMTIAARCAKPEMKQLCLVLQVERNEVTQVIFCATHNHS